MANVKISELPAATLPLAGSELVPIVQSGTTDQVTVANLTAGRTVSAAAVTATGTVSGATVTATGTVSGATVSGTTVVAGAGTAAAPSISPTGDSNTGLFFPAADTIAFTEGGVEAMRLDASGNVGIGTTTASGRLDVSSTAQYAGITLSGSGRVWQVGSNSTAVVTMNFQHDALAFASYGAERARITAGGDFQFNSGYGSVATAYACRAWVNFNGTGTVAIRASGNVSSITDNGVGAYTVNFTVAMPDVNYSAVAFTQWSGGPYIIASAAGSSSYLTSSLSLTGGTTAGANADVNAISVAIFR